MLLTNLTTTEFEDLQLHAHGCPLSWECWSYCYYSSQVGLWGGV
jgi:hypothetical protein